MNSTVLSKSAATGSFCLARLPMARSCRSLFPISLFLFLVSNSVNAQVTVDAVQQAPAAANVGGKALRSMDAKYEGLSARVGSSTTRTLQQMQQKEAALQRRVHGMDSGKAAQLFNGVQEKYKNLLARLNAVTVGAAMAGGTATGGSGPAPKMYFASLDSVHTSMAFLNSVGSVPGISTAAMQKISQLTTGTGVLQQRLEIAEEAQTFLRHREQLWQQSLSKYTSAGQLLSVNKQVYYYQQQLGQYRGMLNNKDQLEEKALAAVQQMPAFRQFWQKNSAVTRLFPQQQANGAPMPSALQTRDQVLQAANHLSPTTEGGANTTMNVFQQQAEKGQQDLGSLKSRLNGLGLAGGSTTMTLPDFTPNSQHGKPLMQRIEVGFSLQSGGATTFLPATLQPALYAGYRFSDKFTVGAGASYILGLGQSLKSVRLSNQGIGLRTYFDARCKGSFWFTGGFEYNYLQEFSSIRMISRLDAWQRSALTGIMKKFRLGRKEGKLQLMYDWLYADKNPKGQPLVFRTAYSF